MVYRLISHYNGMAWVDVGHGWVNSATGMSQSRVWVNPGMGQSGVWVNPEYGSIQSMGQSGAWVNPEHGSIRSMGQLQTSYT